MCSITYDINQIMLTITRGVYGYIDHQSVICYANISHYSRYKTLCTTQQYMDYWLHM